MADEESNSGVETHSRQLAQIFGWAFWLTAFWLITSVSYLPLKRFGIALGTPEVDALAAGMAFARVLFGHLPVIIAMGAVYTARRLFVQFSTGRIFVPETGVNLARIGDWLIVSAAAAFLLPGSSRPEGVDETYLTDTYFAVVMVLVGLSIRLFGRTFRIAADIKADNDQMV